MGPWRRWFTRDRADTDHARELEAVRAILIDEYLERGLSPDEATRQASLKLGNTTRLREEVYMMSIDVVLQDLRYAFRQLRAAPGFAVVIVLTLALGIGANAAIFSVIRAALLRYLPVPQADRLVFLNTTNSVQAQSGDGDTSLTDFIFEQLRHRSEVFTNLVAFAPLRSDKVAVRYQADPEEADVELVSGDFFSGLGVQPALGRTFTLADETTHASVAILSYDFWARRQNRDPLVLGHAIAIRGVPFTVVGVAARGFAGVEHERSSDVYIPLQTRPDLQPWGAAATGGLSLYGVSPRWWCLKVIGRLAPGIPPQAATARMDPIFNRAGLAGITKQYPSAQQPHLYLTPVRGIDGMRDDYGRPLAAVMAMVVTVLLIACLNIGVLLAARHRARHREFSVRLAIGAGRARLFQQLVIESLVLVGLGTALAWLFAIWASGALAGWSGLGLNFAPDAAVLAATVALAAVITIALGLAAVPGLARLRLANVLRAAISTTPDARSLRMRQALLTLQVGLCLALLVGAGLLVQSLRNLDDTDLGFRPAGLLVFGVGPQNVEPAQAQQLYGRLLAVFRAVPGVESVTLMRNRLGSGWSSNSSVMIDGADPKGDGNAHVRWNPVGPDYFHVLQAALVLGRDFMDADSSAAPRVAIVNQTFATQFLAGREALGHALTLGTAPPARIVGVVRDIKYTGTREKAQPMAWIPYTQASAAGQMQFEARTFGDALSLLPALRGALHRVAPDLPVLQPSTQEAEFEQSYSDNRIAGRLGVFFAVLAVLLVSTGLYGTLAYTVNRRTPEIGVRMALGAQRGQVLWMVLRASLGVCVSGIVIGVPLALASTRLLSAMLYGVRPVDPVVFGLAFAGLLAVALAASWIPARRAVSIEPLLALRRD